MRESITVWFNNAKKWKTRLAVSHMKSAMKKDPDYANTWQCNIAMPIMDNANEKLSHKEANDIADILMRHLFDVVKQD